MANSVAILNNLSTKLKLSLVYNYVMIGNFVEMKFLATCFFKNQTFRAVGSSKKLAKAAVSDIVLEKFPDLVQLASRTPYVEPAKPADLPQLPASFSEPVKPADLPQLPASFSEPVKPADLPQLPAFSKPVKPTDLPQLSVSLPDSPLCLYRKLNAPTKVEATSSIGSSIFVDDDKPLGEPLGQLFGEPYMPPIKKRKLNSNEKHKLLKTAKKLAEETAKNMDSLNKVLSQLIQK